MRIPDAITLDKLCEMQQVIGMCTDGNCDACIIERIVIKSKKCENLLLNIITDKINNAHKLVTTLACGILLGIEFQKMQSDGNVKEEAKEKTK